MEKEALLNSTFLLPGHRCLKTMCPCLTGITIKRHLRKMKTKVDFLAQTLHLIGEESPPNPSHIGYLLIKYQMQNEFDVSVFRPMDPIHLMF